MCTQVKNSTHLFGMFACPRLCRPIVWPVWEELSFQPWAQVSTHNFNICVSFVYIYIYALKSGTRRQVILQSEPGQADITSRPSKTWRLITVTCMYKRGFLGLFFHCFPAGFYMNRPLSVVWRYPRTKQKHLKSRKAATSRWVCIGPRQFYLGCSTDYSLGRR